MTATSLPRMARIAFSSSGTTSRPLSLMLPSMMLPPDGSSFMIDIPVMLLPQPDSPTSPSVSPGAICSERPSTARTVVLLSLM